MVFGRKIGLGESVTWLSMEYSGGCRWGYFRKLIYHSNQVSYGFLDDGPSMMKLMAMRSLGPYQFRTCYTAVLLPEFNERRIADVSMWRKYTSRSYAEKAISNTEAYGRDAINIYLTRITGQTGTKLETCDISYLHEGWFLQKILTFVSYIPGTRENTRSGHVLPLRPVNKFNQFFVDRNKPDKVQNFECFKRNSKIQFSKKNTLLKHGWTRFFEQLHQLPEL